MGTQPWVEGTYLAVDTETTGVDPFADRIVEVSAVRVGPAGQVLDDPFTTVVNPGIDIPDAAAEIHGITTERAVAEGLPTVAAVDELGERIHQAVIDRIPVVAYNARFDWPVLISEAERHGLDFPAFAPVLDPYLIDRILDPYRKGGRKLVTVCGHYGVALADADAHGALADAVAAAQVMRAIARQFPQVRERTLASLFLRQARGHARWREEFIDWTRRNRDPQFTIPHGWPIPAGPLPAPLEPASTGQLAPADDVPAEPPPARPDDGNEVAGSGEPATSDPAPSPQDRTNAVGVRDVSIYAGRVFKADGDAAPKGDKTKTVDRLRHALTWACTNGRVASLNDTTPDELIGIYQWLHHIADRKVTYTHDDDGVTFTLAAKGTERRVLFADLEQLVAA